MTSKLTRERLQEIAEDGFLQHGESKVLARMALAAMDSEPVAWLAIYHGEIYDDAIGITRSVVEDQADRFGWESALTEIIPLYPHAQPAPVVPDGYVIVPKEPTQAMCAAFNDSDYGRKSLRERYVAMLAAAAHDTPALNSVQSVATVPGKWVPVSERMPETDGNYWGWWSESKRQGPVWFIKSELQAQFQSHEITHWMPLPADPQEVSNEK